MFLRQLAEAEGVSFLLIRHSDHRHDHLFQTYAAMLKSIAVIIGKMIVIIGVT